MAGPTTIDEYLATVSEERRAGLTAIREAVSVGAPEAVEGIAYNMPAFRSQDGRFLVSFDGYKRHFSLFPASEAVVTALGDRLTPHLAGKGTIQFAADRPIPTDLVTEIARIRWVETTAAGRE